ncbi:MAG: sensor histidine kinase [Planctomycetota bacterium]|jgi:signal transduction histidine kinase
MSELAAASAGQDALPRVKQAEAALAALQRELDHTHQLATLGTLTAGIAHEINNILTPVLAYAQLARANPDDTALGAKALERTIAGVESASRITEAVLGFARSDEKAVEKTDVKAVIDASVACLGRDPARDGIELQVEVDNGSQVRIRPLALQQVLLNLMLNAMKALQGRRGELRITSKAGGDGRTEITVADNGPGIPEEVTATLFEPFVSGPRCDGEASSRSRPGGSGLGLAVCKRLIENAGGTIVVDSSPGCGATFKIQLPTSNGLDDQGTD